MFCFGGSQARLDLYLGWKWTWFALLSVWKGCPYHKKIFNPPVSLIYLWSPFHKLYAMHGRFVVNQFVCFFFSRFYWMMKFWKFWIFWSWVRRCLWERHGRRLVLVLARWLIGGQLVILIGYSLGKAWYSLGTQICWKSPNLNHFDIKQSKNFNINVRFLYDFTC